MVNRSYIAECRRLGKTSLIGHAIHSCKELTGIYCDFRLVSSYETLIEALIKTAGMKLKTPKEIRETLIDLREESGRLEKISHQKDFIRKIFKVFNSLRVREKKIIYIFDEFQSMNLSKNKEIEEFLRSIIQQYPDLSIIYLGSERRALMNMFQENGNGPFSGQAERFNLNPIPINNFYEYFFKIFKDIKLDKSAFEYVYDLCAGVSEDIQRAMIVIYEKSELDNPPVIVEEYVRTILLNRSMEQHNDFLDKISSLNDDQKRVLIFIARNQKIPEERRNDYIKLKKDILISRAIEQLIKNKIIEEYNKETQYRIYSYLFKNWLIHYKEPRSLISVNKQR
jgi:hypothetical protein